MGPVVAHTKKRKKKNQNHPTLSPVFNTCNYSNRQDFSEILKGFMHVLASVCVCVLCLLCVCVHACL